VISTELICEIVVDGLGNATDDVVPVIDGGGRAREHDGVSEEQLKIDEVCELVAGNKTERVARSSCTGHTTDTMNKELGPD